MKSFKFKNGTYKGQVNINNLPHGKGELVEEKIEKNRSVSGKELKKKITKIYSGNWTKGKMSGKGKLKIDTHEDYLDCVDIYSGNWKNNFLEGFGKYLQYIDGIFETKYEGNFKKNKYNGKGTTFFRGYSKFDPELNKQIGNFKNGNLEGEAIYVDSLFENEDYVIVKELLEKLKSNKKLEKKLGITSAKDLDELNTYMHNNGSIMGFEPSNGEKGEIYAERKGKWKSGMPIGLHICKIFYQKLKNKKKLIATFKGVWKKSKSHSGNDIEKKSLIIHN